MQMKDAVTTIATTKRKLVVEVETATGSCRFPVRRSDVLSALVNDMTSADGSCELRFIDRPDNVLAITGGDLF